jgi:hypothetical protein
LIIYNKIDYISNRKIKNKNKMNEKEINERINEIEIKKYNLNKTNKIRNIKNEIKNLKNDTELLIIEKNIINLIKEKLIIKEIRINSLNNNNYEYEIEEFIDSISKESKYLIKKIEEKINMIKELILKLEYELKLFI